MERNGHLDSEFCKEIIDKFENDSRKLPGMAGTGLNPDLKSSIDLNISHLKEWDEIVEKLDVYIKQAHLLYIEWLEIMLPRVYDSIRNSKHVGFQIQKSGKYDWHHDSAEDEYGNRLLTFIWYLNDVPNGGETDFVYKKVTPQTGKLIFFPSTWDYLHAGLETENKYIITGWFY
jgi:2OG-Fe(II) oxygenase superfamily